jgi:inhibitor of cysteine peptidase
MAELSLTQANNGQSYEVGVDDALVIRLEANPTTGYVWAIHETDEQILAFQTSQFIQPADMRLGAPTIQEIRFKAISAGAAPIRLKYWREWLGDASVSQRYEVTITVRG